MITRRECANNLHALAQAVTFSVLPIEALLDDMEVGVAAHAFVGTCTRCVMLSWQFHAWGHEKARWVRSEAEIVEQAAAEWREEGFYSTYLVVKRVMVTTKHEDGEHEEPLEGFLHEKITSLGLSLAKKSKAMANPCLWHSQKVLTEQQSGNDSNLTGKAMESNVPF
ncbi:hypothetical protein ZIOFF_061799 [Zingiber officinale]|uniref:Lipid desaturase domain-containing protein n=1 Tax=Zingiber officinale TaxID=94328 RepID=A0A8J5EZJ2_ZINOF|nr:hypothetical protein ZIOFF_061799 [Zingiber officinale]